MTETDERVTEMARPLTPRSDRSRRSYGSLLMSIMTVPDRCESRKCVKPLDHGGNCWPKG